MPRHRYRITQDDAMTVWNWLDKKLEDYEWSSDNGWEDRYQVKQEFQGLEARWRDPEALNAWAEKWLNREQWKQLQNVVRAQRKRKLDRVDRSRKPVSITVAPQAHHLLRSIAEHDRVTLSQVIEKYLKARYREAIRNG